MHEIKLPSRSRYILGALIISAIFLYGSLFGHPWFQQDRVHSNLDENTASETEETPISNVISSLDNLLDIRNETLGVKYTARTHL